MIVFEDGTVISHSFDYMDDPNCPQYTISTKGLEMKQQNLKESRDYRKNPRSAHEGMVKEHRATVHTPGPSMAKQSEAEACDINNIMKRYEATGFLPQSDGRTPMWEDFSTMETFQEALHVVSAANNAFYSLPAEIRARFQNDPAQFLGFVENPANMPELVKMGLAEERPQKPTPEASGKAQSRQPKPKGETNPDGADGNKE